MARVRNGNHPHCARKIPYSTKAVAKQTASRLRAKSPTVPKLYAYKCPHCRLWHLSKLGPGVWLPKEGAENG